MSGGTWDEELKWTVFPAPIGLGATFDVDLIKTIGGVTATEGRALHNEMLATHNGSSVEAAGLNCFSPNVNLFRDPRWGRGQETFGEDPYHISLIGNAYTLGLQQGEDSRYLKIAACAKHYAVHSGPEEVRLNFTAQVTLHDLYDTYLPAFKSQVVGSKVAQIMPAYSAINCSEQPDSAPDTANIFLLQKVLREQFSAPNISVCSDNGGVSRVFSGHKYVDSAEKAAAVCINATTDLDLGHDITYTENLGSAVKAGLVEEHVIRQSVVRSIYLRMLVGDFDPPSRVPYQLIDRTSLDTDHSKAMNLQAARESLVLLKKTAHLPIKMADIKRIAIIGPNANNSHVMLSNYEGIPSSVVTVFQGVQQFLGNSSSHVMVEYALGCTVQCPNKKNYSAALDLALRADYVIMVMGLSDEVEGENHDRMQTSCLDIPVPHLGLPGCQTKLVEAVAAINPRVVLVLINGGPLSIQTLQDNHRVVGIVEAFYPGAVGGTAIAEVLFGAYNPGGKMPVSVYRSTSDLPPEESYDMTMYPGRTYRYSEVTPLYPFGFGLSYSEFNTSSIEVSLYALKPCDSITVSVIVENTTPGIPGHEVVMVYLSPVPDLILYQHYFPRTQLVAFKRVYLLPKVPQKVTFEINPYLLSLVWSDGKHYVVPAVYGVEVGTESAYIQIVGDKPVETSTCTKSPQCLSC